MKKLVIGISVVTILAFGTLAFAHGYGGWGGGHMMNRDYGGHMTGPGYGGHMMGPGYGGHMMDRGYGGHMMDRYGQDNKDDRKFLDETAGLRKELHDKKFEYFEARRDPGTTTEKLSTLEKELYAIQEKINEQAPKTAYRGNGGYGHCF
jgi:hypothetical protein